MIRTFRRAPGAAVLTLVLGLALGAVEVAQSADATPSPHRLWVFLADKGLTRADEGVAVARAAATLSPRALARRAKVGMPVTVRDVPVAPEHVGAVEATGARVVVRSRWLNAVSVEADASQAAAIAALPFVREVRPVARARKELPQLVPTAPATPRGGRSLDYGPALGQLDQIQVPDLHDQGFDGSGVLIAMFDTGFDTDHQAYRHLDVVAERDFINNDAVTADQPGDPPGQDSHGTATLSCVGGAYAGQLYGGSYRGSFALAKTERVDTEIQAEEDHWVAAAEWADSLGADVISSSLGYLDWYTYEDMDGNTAVTTIAADMAAARGVVVVNSMGNEGGSAWRYMIAPADGDSVVAVGAVNSDGIRVSFSSVGPTYDGRIKPDVMAQGRHVYVATTSDTASYATASGTSFSCPLTAGAVGLLLQAHPHWTPSMVIEALRETATQSASPDTLMGWGIVQAADAMVHQPSGVPGDEGGGSRRPVVSASRSPFDAGTALSYFVPGDGRARVAVYDVAGRLVRVLADGRRPAGWHAAAWDGADAAGAPVASGVYFARVIAAGRSAVAKLVVVR
ncbi:MAG: S8 family serine peptidase [Candidatus Eisenbacteria bacterium]|nr:S8 family serine peptidase [Candidatus Eisenbacteria bacterium]